LANNIFSFFKGVNSKYGTIESPGSTPNSSASSLEDAPISINISLISTGFLRASGDRMCGGFDPITPVTSPSLDRKSTRLNSSHVSISYAVFCLKKKTQKKDIDNI